jgi:hypothetical protein
VDANKEREARMAAALHSGSAVVDDEEADEADDDDEQADEESDGDASD